MVEIVGDSVEATEFGCNGVSPQAQSSHIANGAGTGSTQAAVNNILVVLEKFGFVATS